MYLIKMCIVSNQENSDAAAWEYKPVWLALVKVCFHGLDMSSNCPTTADQKLRVCRVTWKSKRLELISLLFYQVDIHAWNLYTSIGRKTEFVQLQHWSTDM